ncbi:MAG: hypothetical protein AAFZ63_04450 [Bacteroidota bacterium]
MKTKFFNTRLSMLAFSAALMLSLFAFNSCEKDQVEPTTAPNGEVTFREETGDGDVNYAVADELLGQIDYGAINYTEELGILKFASDDNLQQTLQLIEGAANALNEEIYSSIAGLPEEEVDAMEINDNYAYEVFEDNFPQFTSFRAMANEEIEAFFAQEELNDEADPSDVYDAIPDVLGTVLNATGEVASYDGGELEEQVHIAKLDGGNYTVMDGDAGTVRTLRGDLSFDEISEIINVKVVDEPEEGRSCCRSNRTVSNTRYVNQWGRRYRAKYRVRIRNFSFFFWNVHRASSQLKSRRKSGWFWKKHYTTISINQQGNVYPSTYYTYTCVKAYYDFVEEKWKYKVDTCVGENKCDGEALSAATSGTIYTWKHERTRNYSSKVSASDKDGTSGILRATFTWRGQTLSLSIC